MMNNHCGCQDASRRIAPQSVVNAAGASRLSARVGAHGTLFESLLRRLSSRDFPQLQLLRTRELADPAIALLDAWCSVADVLTFYNERIVDESYLRTAREIRSLIELSKHVGHRPGPGVSASVFLAFTLQKDPKESELETTIPAGTACKSVPGDEEQPQTFETSFDLRARMEWNAIRPRRTIPQRIEPSDVVNLERLYLEGTDYNLKQNDRVLVFPNPDEKPTPITIEDVVVDQTERRTIVILGESAFSTRTFARTITPQMEQFRKVADATSGFPWIAAQALSLKTVIDGSTAPPAKPALATWSRMSQFDLYLRQWVHSVNEVKAHDALTELTDTSSAFSSIAEKIKDVASNDLPLLFPQARAVCDELKLLDPMATTIYAIVKLVTDPNNAAQVSTAKTSLDALVLPTVTKLTPHRDKLVAVVTAVTQLNQNPGGAAEISTFQAARMELKNWWGLKTNGDLNANAADIHDYFEDLLSALDDVSNSPKQKLEAIVLAKKNVDDETGSPSGPAQQRIDQLSAALKLELDVYAFKLTTALKPALKDSEILKRVDSLLLETIRTEADLGVKHKKAVDLANDPDRLPEVRLAAQELARLIVNLTTAVDTKRKLFAAEAAKILESVKSLELLASVEVRVVWDLAKKILNDVQATSGTFPPFVHDFDLCMTIAGIVGAAQPPGLIRSIELLGEIADPTVNGLVKELLRQLKRFVYLDGFRLTSTPTPISEGGLGQVVESESGSAAAGKLLVRIARDVLEIPSNTVADAVAQLASTFGLIPTAEFKAKWRAIRNDEPVATASLLSPPIPLFGHNAPRALFKDQLPNEPEATKDWQPSDLDLKQNINLAIELPTLTAPNYLQLRFSKQTSATGDPVPPERLLRIRDVQIRSRASYGLTAKVTHCEVEDPDNPASLTDWRPLPKANDTLEDLRNALAYVPVKNLLLSETPLEAPIGPGAAASASSLPSDFDPETNQIELDGLYLDIDPGRWIVLAGERADLPGVIASESARITYVRHILRKLPGDRVHTRIFLNAPLRFNYRRDTLVISANVVRATHGETTQQVLGSGDASQPFQSFALAKAPLTFVAAPTPAGVRSTLNLRVNDLLWHEQESLNESDGVSHDFVLHVDDLSRGLVQFGDGRTGARLPTGRENVRARYRVGLGSVGNVQAGQISQLAHTPRGVKGVTNPLPATGGADADTVDQLRANAPVAVMALDRLVSIRDYADFARNFAGIDKALANRLVSGGQSVVHVSLAGADDNPLASDSDLLTNLRLAYARWGDPRQAVQLCAREFLIVFLSARVKLLPDYAWGAVEPAIRRRLYAALGFAQAALARSVYQSQVHSAIQSVAGVEYVDIDIFDAVSESEFRQAVLSTAEPTQGQPTHLQQIFNRLRNSAPRAGITALGPRLDLDQNQQPIIRPAQLAYLSPRVPDSLFLEEIRR